MMNSQSDVHEVSYETVIGFSPLFRTPTVDGLEKFEPARHIFSTYPNPFTNQVT